MRIFGVAVAVVILALSCHAIDSEESADRDDFYDSRGESDALFFVSPTIFFYLFIFFLATTNFIFYSTTSCNLTSCGLIWIT